MDVHKVFHLLLLCLYLGRKQQQTRTNDVCMVSKKRPRTQVPVRPSGENLTYALCFECRMDVEISKNPKTVKKGRVTFASPTAGRRFLLFRHLSAAVRMSSWEQSSGGTCVVREEIHTLQSAVAVQPYLQCDIAKGRQYKKNVVVI